MPNSSKKFDEHERKGSKEEKKKEPAKRLGGHLKKKN